MIFCWPEINTDNCDCAVGKRSKTFKSCYGTSVSQNGSYSTNYATMAVSKRSEASSDSPIFIYDFSITRVKCSDWIDYRHQHHGPG